MAHIADALRHEAARLVGRDDELARLEPLITEERPLAVHLHGLAGIGKSRLLDAFVARCEQAHIPVLRLSGHALEPSPQGVLTALASRLGLADATLESVVRGLGRRGPRVLLVLDAYERLRLVDTWLRLELVPALDTGVRLLSAGRDPASAAWRTAPGFGSLFEQLELGPLARAEACSLAVALGAEARSVDAIAELTCGHPLAITLAATSRASRVPAATSFPALLEELAEQFLADIASGSVREALEAACLLRRATWPTLRAMCPALAHESFDALCALPFVRLDADGLVVHELVRKALAGRLRATDPVRYTELRRAAWRALEASLAATPRNAHWRFTADVLYMLDNEAVRASFFPEGLGELSVLPASAADAAAIRSLGRERLEAADEAALALWLERMPAAFHVIRERDGQLAGFYAIAIADELPQSLRKHDVIAQAWCGALSDRDRTAALFVRFAVTRDPAPRSPAQAAQWLDVKRSYLALRPRLRWVFVLSRSSEDAGPVLSLLDFRPLPGPWRDGTCCFRLDMGPDSVDGWLVRLLRRELGLAEPSTRASLLDREGHQLVLSSGPVLLTPLELGVLRELEDARGNVVSRADLLSRVWGLAEGAATSNVLEATVRTLRRKLGPHAHVVETVRGAGYRYADER